MAGICSALCAEPVQGTNEVTTLPTVTVYASRTGDRKDSMPASIAVFTAADIEASGARDLPVKKYCSLVCVAAEG